MMKSLAALCAAAAVTIAVPAAAKQDSRAKTAEMVPVGNNVMMVMANPVPGKDAEFNSWYDGHIRDIMKLPGMIRAQRFKMLSRTGRPDPAFSYIILYEFTGSQDAITAAMGTAAKEGRLAIPDKAFVLKTEASTWNAYMPGFIAKK
jgi:hypothetical protein